MPAGAFFIPKFRKLGTDLLGGVFRLRARVEAFGCVAEAQRPLLRRRTDVYEERCHPGPESAPSAG